MFINEVEMSLIGRSLDPASISALAAILGSLTGALASSVSTWIIQRHVQDIISNYSKPNLTPEQIQFGASNREDLLPEFSHTCRAELEGMQRLLR